MGPHHGTKIEKSIGSLAWQLTKHVSTCCGIGVVFFLCNVHILFPLLISHDLKRITDLGLLAPVLFITVPPAYTAVLYTVHRFLQGDDTWTVIIFLRAYKSKFKQAFLIGLMVIFMLTSLYVYGVLLISYGAPIFLRAVPYGLMLFIVLMAIQVFPMIAHGTMATYALFKLALYYTIKRVYIPVLMLLCCFISLFLFDVMPLSIVVSPVVMAYIQMVLYRPIYKEIRYNNERENDSPPTSHT
ncbi:DUF624 domain-containing protein [Vallitalea pronyensis]|uniref:DUF624 domain-containing protein n=1 Tax=Vallitalea pronyensis TaxID=1348613 RepID=A0A8J8MPK2_9FIRM|nr:DUF624 domain-containing protein [Vallitalea pronyensis]QUI25264.1 DUF624 domain-containing protein [Vallitalea pronyensis]